MKPSADKNFWQKPIVKYFAIFILQSIIQFQLYGQQLPSIRTDRPDQTESPSTVLRNHLQIETGISFEKTDDESDFYTYPTILVRCGVTDNLELRLILNNITSHVRGVTYSGITPVTAGFKVKLTEEKGILPMLSFLGYLTIPDLASKNLKATWYATSFKIAMQNTLSQKISIGYNVGIEWDGETPQPTFIYSLSTGYSITEKIASFIELYGFLLQRSTGNHRMDAGFSYLLKNNMMIDISAGLGINKYAPANFIAAGYSIRLKN